MLSYHIQHSWQKGFLASTHFEANKHKFLNPYHYPQNGSGGRKSGTPRQFVNGCNENFPVKNMLFNCLRSVANHFTSWPLRDNVLLFLEGVTREFPSSIALALHVQSRNVLHASGSFQSILSQFISKDSFLTLDDLEFVFKNHGDLVKAVTDRPMVTSASSASSSSSSGTEESQQHFNRKLELILVDDGRCACSADVLFLGSISLSVLRFRRIATSPYDDVAEVALEEEFNEEAVLRALGAYAEVGSEAMSICCQNTLNAQAQSMAPRDMTLNSASGSSFAGKKGKMEYGKRPSEFGGATAEDSLKRVPSATIVPNSVYSSSSMSLQRACGSFLLTSDKHNVPQQVGSNLMRPVSAVEEPEVSSDLYALLGENPDQIESGFRAEEILPRDPIVNIVYSGRSGMKRMGSGKRKPAPVLSSTSGSNNPTLLSATTTVDAAPYVGISQAPSSAPSVPTSFESILQSLLRVIPFHVVEIWVPVQLEDGATVMLFGASAALDKDLHGWSQYSRNFSFHPDVGLPGRVATARIAESQPDVASLSMPTFLRAEMAGSLGIHAACGLPFFTGSKCDAVVVFYSRHIFEPTPSLIEYMGHICELLNIRAQIRILKPRCDGSRPS